MAGVLATSASVEDATIELDFVFPVGICSGVREALLLQVTVRDIVAVVTWSAARSKW